MAAEKPTHLKHKVNGSVWPYSEGLARNRNMIPCDADGREIVSVEKHPDPYLSEELKDGKQGEPTKVERDSLDDMSKDDLLAFATLNDLDIDKRLGVDRLREAVREAMLKKA